MGTTTTRRSGPALRAAAAVALAAGLLLPASGGPANAEGVTVRDSEPGREASFLAISRARFTNGEHYVRVRATHPGLVLRHVDRYELRIIVGRWRLPKDDRLFVFRWDRDTSRPAQLITYRQGTDAEIVVPCPGARLTRVGARFGADARPGQVEARVPHRCLRASGQVRLGYVVGDTTAWVTDSAPGHSHDDMASGFTRWLRRG